MSQSFFPLIGGVSSFLAALVCGLIGLGYRVHVLHFAATGSELFSERYPSVHQHQIDALRTFTPSTLQGYARFKEQLYCKLHGLDAEGIGDLSAIDGYHAHEHVAEAFSRRATDIIKAHNVDILYLHDYQLFPVLDVGTRAKKVFSIHTPVLSSYPRGTISFLREIVSRADRALVSIPEYQAALTSVGNPLPVTCLPPFVDNEVQSTLLGATVCDFELPRSPFIVTSIQRFDAKSGHQLLIRGFARFVATHPAALLVLVGGPSFTDSIADVRDHYYRDARALTMDLGISNSVLFAGSVPYQCIPAIYDRTDVFSLLSRSECFGLALTEAMSRRVPAIVSRVGGLHYQIRDGRDGLTVGTDDPAAVAAALACLYKRPDLRMQYAQSAHRRYLTLFHPAVLLRRYHALFLSL